MLYWKILKNLTGTMNEKIKIKFLPADPIEMPDDLKRQEKKAVKLEVVTFVYLFTVVIVMYLTLSSSQAMKAAWLEDVLTMVPSATFLVASRFYNKKPNFMFPNGFHRVFSVGFAFGALALLGLGLYVAFDSVLSLVKAEHATIPHKPFFGREVWFGWLMILALLYSFIPAVILGRKKKPISKMLHNKLLNVDAEAQKADWMTASAAIVGIMLLGFGIWWADAVAAVLISVSIIKDGVRRITEATKDLIGQAPTTINGKIDPVNEAVIDFFMEKEWVKDVRIKLREEGQVFTGDVYVIPENEENIVDNIEKAFVQLRKLDWGIHEISIQPVKSFDFRKADTE